MRAHSIRERQNGEPPETSLLVLASRPLVMRTDVTAIHSILAHPLDWTALVSSAMRHGVTAQAFGRLLEVARSELPSDIAEAASAHIDHLRIRNQGLIAELFAILDALETASIDVIPLKGPLLAHLVYRDATIRACRDLDFLVRSSDVERAIDVLSKLGYHPDAKMPNLTGRQRVALNALHGQALLWRRGARAAIEPHWTLAPANLSLAIDYEGMWRRSRPIVFEGREVRSLAPEDLVLVIVIHGGKDEWSRLQSVLDLARAIARFSALDWPLVLARAKQQRCLHMLLTGMRLAERLMGMMLPPAIAVACSADRGADALAAVAADHMLRVGPTKNSIFAVSKFRFRLHDRWWDRTRYLAATVLTPREHHFGLIRLPDCFFCLYFPIKLIHDYVLLPIWLVVKQGRKLATRPIET
jgi:putative nucleotidyltransferase-like protein